MSAPDALSIQNDEWTAQWVQSLDDDLAMAANGLIGPNYVPKGVLFHLQQAAEKLMKLILIAHNIEPPYIHNLKKLQSYLGEFPEALSILKDLNALEGIDTVSRYPEESGAWEPPDWDALYSMANLIIRKRAEILSFLNLPHLLPEKFILNHK